MLFNKSYILKHCCQIKNIVLISIFKLLHKTAQSDEVIQQEAVILLDCFGPRALAMT